MDSGDLIFTFVNKKLVGYNFHRSFHAINLQTVVTKILVPPLQVSPKMAGQLGTSNLQVINPKLKAGVQTGMSSIGFRVTPRQM